jgi:hypothetical protein
MNHSLASTEIRRLGGGEFASFDAVSDWLRGIAGESDDFKTAADRETDDVPAYESGRTCEGELHRLVRLAQLEFPVQP